MPKIKATYGELRARQFNILEFRNTYWAVASIFTPLRTSVMRYEKLNAIPLKHLFDKEQQLIKLHVARSEDGKPLWEEENALRVAGSLQTNYRGQNNLVPVFLDSDHARDFNNEWVALMQKECEITI